MNSVVLATLLMLTGGAWPAAAETMEVRLSETPEGRWEVAFRFSEPQRAVVMRQAPEPYRAGAWTSRSPGVAMEKIGRVDVITFESPGQEAVFEIEPHTTSLSKAYTPFLAFSDGSWGVLEGQFRASMAADRDAVVAFDDNGENWPGPLVDYTFTLTSPRAVFYDGEWIDGAMSLTPEGDGKYAYVGSAAVDGGDNFVGFIDRGLPAWIRDAFSEDVALVFEVLSDEWRVSLPERAEVLFVFDGADTPGLQQTGGAIGHQLALQVGGAALLEPDGSIIDFFRWFLAHESAHLFQHAAGMGEVPSEHAWLHEGAANTMSYRIGARLSQDGAAFLSEVYGAAFADCAGYLESGTPLVDAVKIGAFDAYYACGDLIALVTEAELDDGDIFDFWRSFLAEASATHAGSITAERYFDHAERAGLSGETRTALEALVGEPISDPVETLTRLLDAAGLAPTFDEKGALRSLALPD